MLSVINLCIGTFWTELSCWYRCYSNKAMSSLQKSFGRYHDLDESYEISIFQMTLGFFLLHRFCFYTSFFLVGSVLSMFLSPFLCCVLFVILLLCCLSLYYFVCVQGCQCIWIVHTWLPFRFSLRLIHFNGFVVRDIYILFSEVRLINESSREITS